MNKQDLATIKEILDRNPAYIKELTKIVEAESKLRVDDDLDIVYDCDLPFRFCLNGLRDLYRAHGQDPDFRQLAVDIINDNVNLVVNYIDQTTKPNDKFYSKEVRILIGESIKASAILGLIGCIGDSDLDFGVLFRSRAIRGDLVTKHLLGGLKLR